MFDRKTLGAAVAAFVVMFALAGLWNQVLVSNFIADEIDATVLRDPPITGLIIAGYLLLAFMMAWLYPRLAGDDAATWLRGLKFGILIVFVWMLPFNLIIQGVYNFPLQAIPMDTIWACIEQGIGGIVVALARERL